MSTAPFPPAVMSIHAPHNEMAGFFVKAEGAPGLKGRHRALESILSMIAMGSGGYRWCESVPSCYSIAFV